ncbi:hypothetical protein [Marinicrinis sediminis]|uniref:Spore coat protein n=1 Tax=Marinicrinis sediminis TaxID=1652465 RepID=A0ABW5RA49_9BACL
MPNQKQDRQGTPHDCKKRKDVIDQRKGFVTMYTSSMPSAYTQQTLQGGGMSSSQGLTTKEVAYLTDCMKNEEMLMKTSMFAAQHCQQGQLSQLFGQFAHDSFNDYLDMLGMIQQKASQTGSSVQ